MKVKVSRSGSGGAVHDTFMSSAQRWTCIKLITTAGSGVALLAHPLPNISNRFMERKETIWGNTKKSVFGCWPINPVCETPEVHCVFATLKMPLTFRGPYMVDGRN